MFKSGSRTRTGSEQLDRTDSTSSRLQTATASAPASSASPASSPTSPSSTGMTEIPSPSEMAWLNRLTDSAHDGSRLRSSDAGSARVDHRLDVGERLDAAGCLDGHTLREAFAQELDVGDGGRAVATRGGGGEVGARGRDDATREPDALVVQLPRLEHDLDEYEPLAGVDALHPDRVDERSKLVSDGKNVGGDHGADIENDLDLGRAVRRALLRERDLRLRGLATVGNADDGAYLDVAAAQVLSRRGHELRQYAHGSEMVLAGLGADALDVRLGCLELEERVVQSLGEVFET